MTKPNAVLKFHVLEEAGTATASVSQPSPAAGSPADLGVVRFTSRRFVPVRALSPADEPLVGVFVSLVGVGGSESRLLTLESVTTFVLEDGAYRVEAKPFTVRAPTALTVAGPWRDPPVAVVLEDAFVLKGRCVHHGAGTPNWARVVLRGRARAKNADVVARLDAEGRFAVALPQALRGAELEVETPYANLVSGLHVPGDDTPLVVDLPADRTLTLVVHAVDATGAPLPFRWGRFERVPSGTSLLDGWSGGPSADGELSFWPVPAGSYRASVDLWDDTRSASDVVTLERDRQVVPVRFGH